MPNALSLRDPVHGFVHADPLEAALVNSRPLQRLRWIRQLGLTSFVYPGAEHSRFSHALGAMHLAGRVYDALAARGTAPLPIGPASRERRLARIAALLHDQGHAPFSHSAEELFEDAIDHEEMTRRLLDLPDVRAIFDQLGDGIAAEDVKRLLAGKFEAPIDRLLCQIVSGELDVDKMDYLLRDSLFCGVRYGHYDLDRVLETILPLADPETGTWGIGVDEGGIHALEALVMARYYMFTQVYFNATGKAMELHLNAWLLETGARWSADPEKFLAEDDLTTTAAMRASDSVHARAVVDREHFPVAFETKEHQSAEEKERFEAVLPGLFAEFGDGNLLISNSAKDPHRFGQKRVWVKKYDGRFEEVGEASQFISHLGRIDRYRVYTPPNLRLAVRAAILERFGQG